MENLGSRPIGIENVQIVTVNVPNVNRVFNCCCIATKDLDCQLSSVQKHVQARMVQTPSSEDFSNESVVTWVRTEQKRPLGSHEILRKRTHLDRANVRSRVERHRRLRQEVTCVAGNLFCSDDIGLVCP
jgi:hypothetical protein